VQKQRDIKKRAQELAEAKKFSLRSIGDFLELRNFYLKSKHRICSGFFCCLSKFMVISQIVSEVLLSLGNIFLIHVVIIKILNNRNTISKLEFIAKIMQNGSILCCINTLIFCELLSRIPASPLCQGASRTRSHGVPGHPG